MFGWFKSTPSKPRELTLDTIADIMEKYGALLEKHPTPAFCRIQTTLGSSISRAEGLLILPSPMRAERSSVAFRERATLTDAKAASQGDGLSGCMTAVEVRLANANR
jgi:hypothetical protein